MPDAIQVRADPRHLSSSVKGSWVEGGKPLEWIHPASRGLVQPAVKCRGREYLRIIYGPEYDSPRHLNRLRQRSVATKRGLALREFALSLEGLDRFIRREPLRKVHECVFGVLALESELVDCLDLQSANARTLRVGS